MRVAVICHRHHIGGHQGHIYDALARRFPLTRVVVEETGWPQRLADLPGGGEFDAIVWRVKLKLLRDQPPFDWQSYRGLRVMLDHDLYRNYPGLWPRSVNYHGAWPPVIQRQGFDLVLVSGKRVCELLRDEGVPAIWMPKAYEAGWLFDKGTQRRGLAYYGSLYSAREAMLDHLDRSPIAVHRFTCPESALNDKLNHYLGVVICNMGMLRGGSGRTTPASEAMLKNFEVAAAGTAPICDPAPDLADLGFVDGLTAVVYTTFEDLVDRLHGYLEQPELLRAIGRRAAALVSERHSWDHRVAFLERLLTQPDPASSEVSWDLSSAPALSK